MKVFNLVPTVVREPGRLSVELANNKQQVILKIFEEIVRGAVIMGINVEHQSAKANALEAIDYIKKQWPYAHVDDICKSIKMGAFGQLKFDGQLSTLSASNIFQWYREFRLSHQDKMVAPPAPIPPVHEEPNEQMKKSVIRESFDTFLKDPDQNDVLVDMHFDKLVKLGLELSNEEKRELFGQEIQKLINNPPIDLYKNKKGRMSIREIQHYWDDLEDKSMYNYHLHSLNPIHKMAVIATKKKAALKWLKTQDRNDLLHKFDEIYG
jgi:hypothetical protein